VAVVWRFLAVVLGGAAGLLTLVFIDRFLPGFWAPVAFACGITAVVYSQDWLKKRGFAFWTSSSIGLGVCAGWLASQGLTSRVIDFEYLPALGLEFFCVISFVMVLVKTMRLPKKDRAPGWWIVALIIMGWCVSVGSSSAGGADHMVEFCVRHGMVRHDAEFVVMVIRKSIHFSFYGSLGLFARNAALSAREKPAAAWRFALLLALAVACFDESRQLSVPGRGASLYDVMLDFSGAVTFNLLSTWRASRRKPKS